MTYCQVWLPRSSWGEIFSSQRKVCSSFVSGGGEWWALCLLRLMLGQQTRCQSGLRCCLVRTGHTFSLTNTSPTPPPPTSTRASEPPRPACQQFQFKKILKRVAWPNQTCVLCSDPSWRSWRWERWKSDNNINIPSVDSLVKHLQLCSVVNVWYLHGVSPSVTLLAVIWVISL